MRTTPASRHSASRVARVAAGGEGSSRSASSSPGFVRAGCRASFASASATARRANTKHSLSEFDASRLAPCSPVHEDSPTAYRPSSVERALRSTTMPPIM